MSESNLTPSSHLLTIPVNRSRDWGHLCMGIGTGVFLSASYALFVYNIYFGMVSLLALALNLFAVYLLKRNR